MNGQLIADGISGALGGLQHSYESEKQQQDAENLAQMRGQVQQMIAQLNDAGRTTRQGMHDDTTQDVTGQKVAGAQGVADTRAGASRDVAGINAGARTDVAGINADSRQGVADTNAGVRYYGIDTRAGTAAAAEAGRNSRWATPSANNNQSTATQRRGQDLTFSLGTDRNAITQRGQDISGGAAAQRDATANKRIGMYENIFGPTPDITDPSAATAPAATAPVALPPRIPAGGGGGVLPVTSRSPSQAAQGSAPIPVTPRATPSAAPAPTAPALKVKQQMVTLGNQIEAEPDPVKKQQMAASLKLLMDQYKSMTSGGSQ